ncbi:primosomal protein N' [Leptolyngbya sp. 'hensonii']|uniref:primosomal protein N' n=1 Tax=Leptolyngbya sp. 'hensonii' TaxID=1922337 RepID=UPI000AF42392|nr:primosomal protein N' [Leptolyngbya sp. 'hensonii']
MAEPAGDEQPTIGGTPWIEVLVDCPGAQGLFTYRLPLDLVVQPGDILTVPFGAQQVGAIAIRFVIAPPPDLQPEQLREVTDVVAPAFFPPHYWHLLHQVATYYHTPLIQVIRVALPPGLLRRSQRRIRLLPVSAPVSCSPAAQHLLALLQAGKTGDYTWQYLRRQVRGADRALRELLHQGLVESYLEPPTPMRPKLQQAVTLTDGIPVDLTPRQQEILDVLRRRGGDLWLTDLIQICHTSTGTLKTLALKGCVVIQNREVLRGETGQILERDQPKALTPAQTLAVQALTHLSDPREVLLHGVTGSGKTEVYLQVIAPLLQAGKSALVLVPEIGLTPQLTDRFRARFGSQVWVYHSALSDGERYDTWRQMLQGPPRVVIGTRSAIFLPLANLGLIILDEEHDNSFKQDQPMPCYHARTVARWRSQLDNCPLVLGSATPSLESWVVSGHGDMDHQPETDTRSLYLTLPHRIHDRPLPPIEVVDMRQELAQGNRSVFSRSLQSALQEMYEQQQQGILFIHRRGHSTFVSCRTCGYVLNCPHCDVSLAYHHTHEGAVQLLRCHYCNHTQLHPPQCPSCQSSYLKFFGSGTQRVVQELAQYFPALRCLRFDSDTTRTKGAHRLLIEQFIAGEADLLVGTQMLTKGLDLPQVTLVGVVAADGLLHLPDYQAGERTFQTLTQVAGRAGRGVEPGRVILQTYTPEHPVIQAVQTYAYQAFIASELAQRSALRYPPCGQLVHLRFSSADEDAVQQSAHQVAEALTIILPKTVELLGPAPAIVARIARRHRWQILLKLPLDRTVELPELDNLRALCAASVSLTIDVDPLQMT